MRFRILLIITLTSLIIGCNTGPDYERDNIRDPASGNFLPEMHSLKVELNNDKTVSLNWKDDSKYEDGIVIAKSLGENGPFKILDTLSANTVNYTDNSKLLDIHTTYYVGAFKNGTAPIDSSRFHSKQLDFGEILDVDFTSNGNEITLNLNSSLTYVDKFIVSENENGAITTVIDTIDGNNSDLTFLVDHESYSIDITVSALLLNHNGDLVLIHQKTKDEMVFNLPTLSGLTLVNEAIINLSIDDNSSFDDEFIVYERTRSAWHQPYSEFIPIDTVTSSGNVFISKNENNEREYAIAGFYQNKKSVLSKPIELDFIPAAPYLGLNDFTSVSTNSVKLTWVDRNTESGRPSTYQFELYLYNSETGELIRQIIIPPTETDYIIDNLNPSIKYEFILKTYNSRTPEPMGFSVQVTLEQVEDYFIARNDGIYAAEIFSDQELIVYSTYQYGASGLKVFDLYTHSSQTIYDTGEDPSEYENKLIEDFSLTENLDLIATLRSEENLDGVNPHYLYIADRSSNTPSYFKKELSLSSSDDEVHIVGFTSGSELIYVYNNSYNDDGFRVYKWNYLTDQTEMIFNKPYYYYSSSYIEDDKIFIGAFLTLFILSLDGDLIQKFHDPSLNKIESIAPLPSENSYILKILGSLYRYNLSTNNVERLGQIDRLEQFLVVPEYNLTLADRQDELFFLDLSTGNIIHRIQDDEPFGFINVAYLPNKDQMVFLYRGRVKIFNLIDDWVVTNHHCC